MSLKKRKGIILAGGMGTRLYPITKVINKQLLPIYDKPMIYYPLSVLMMAKVEEYLIISTKRDVKLYKNLLGNGDLLGINISYAVQERPRGIAEAFLIAEEFIGKSSCVLILGDNIFYGDKLSDKLKNASMDDKCASVFAYHVNDPKRYGVIEFNENKTVLSIDEKPIKPKSNYAVTGLYFYNEDVCDIVKNLKPSNRGELEITDVNRAYLKQKKLKVEVLGRGIAWLDTGTQDSLLEASLFISTLQKRQGLMVGCIEEIAYNNGWIKREKLSKIANELKNTKYGQYLMSISGKKK